MNRNLRASASLRDTVGLVLVCALSGFSHGGAQQASPQAPPKFVAGVGVIEMDVTVLDKDRKPVQGLTAADFRILEDGQPRPIVAFTPVDVPPAVQPAAKWMTDVTPDVESNDLADHRLFVIIVDDSLNTRDIKTLVWRVKQTKLAAASAIEGLRPGDEAAVIFTSAGWDGQEFTTDRRRLLAAVDRMRMAPPTGGGCAPLWGSTDALQAAAEALAAIPHRKKVVLYISVGPAVKLVGPVEGCQDHAQASAQAAIRAAQLGNVAFYGIDPSGLKVDSGSLDPQLQFLDALSSNTGGRMIAQTNDIVSHIPEILAETGSYYLVGYELVGAQHDGRFHRLEVKLDGHPDWEVIARKTRFDSKPPAARADARHPPPSATDLAIGDFVPDTTLPMTATAAPFQSPTGGLVEVAVRVSAPAGATFPARDDATAQISAFTIDGRTATTVRENLPVASEGDSFEIASRIDLKPGRYTLRIAVHSKSLDKTGSVYTDVVVPDFAKAPLSLSGVVLTESTGSSLRGDALAAIEPMTTRTFTPDDRVQAFLRVYQGGAAAPRPASIHIRIVDEHNAAVVDRAETLPASAFARDREADYFLRLPLATLKPGEYWLSMAATMGKTTAPRDVRFTVK